MAKYKILGYEHNEGINKQGKPYNIHVIHAVNQRPMKGKEKDGYNVKEIVVNEGDGILLQIPAVGEVWEFDFNARGRVEDAYIAE